MTGVDVAAVAGLLRDVAREHILPRFENLAAGDIQSKGSGELVTIADVEAELVLARQLGALLPGSVVVGEEEVARDPAVLDRLAGDAPVWVIDPVDGTSNFAAGIPLFAVMVALVRDGEAVAAWIHDPVKDVMATAEQGAGAWRDGTRLAVARDEPAAPMTGAVGNRPMARKLASRGDLVDSLFSFRCAGQEYLALTGGRAQFAYYSRLMPWDHAAGVLLHREAGGVGRRMDGSPYSARLHAGGLLLAPDEARWQALHAALTA